MQDHFLSGVQAFVSISDLSVADSMARLGAVAHPSSGRPADDRGPA